MSEIEPIKNNWVSSMDVNKCLPPELTVQSVEHILHRIGLTLDSTKSYPKRKLFFNPKIIFTFNLLFILREQGSTRGGGIAKIPPPEIENFQKTPP